MVEQHPVILFDGICNFCNGVIHFVIRQDKKGRFRFTTLQSGRGQQLLQHYGLSQLHFDSFILIENGKVYMRSAAALKLSNKLPWYWKWTQILWIVPPFIRNAFYDLIARNRYKWFGRKEQCMVPAPELRSRFL